MRAGSSRNQKTLQITGKPSFLSMLFALKLHDGTAKIAKKQPKKRKSERKNENVTTLNEVRFATTEVEECE